MIDLHGCHTICDLCGGAIISVTQSVLLFLSSPGRTWDLRTHSFAPCLPAAAPGGLIRLSKRCWSPISFGERKHFKLSSSHLQPLKSHYCCPVLSQRETTASGCFEVIMEQLHSCTPFGMDSHRQRPHQQGHSSCTPSNYNSNTSCGPTGASSTSSRCSTNSRLFSFLVLLHSFQVAVGKAEAAAAAAAAPPGPPCVACDDCVTSSCLRICMPSCRTAPAIAEGSDLSTEQCKHKGQDAALDIATAACKLSQVRPCLLRFVLCWFQGAIGTKWLLLYQQYQQDRAAVG